MPIQISEHLAERLKNEEVAWLTTVRADGMPLPTPIWFLWEGGEFLVYSQPGARKIANLRGNPKAALNLNSDESGGSVAVFYGEARIDLNPIPAHKAPGYLEKYREGIASLDMTPEEMAEEYSAAIRLRPTRVREE
jgi:PPOX class probable F420-dependent enzyme